MKNVFARTFRGGQLTVEQQSLTLVNNTAKDLTFTCPDDTNIEVHLIKATNPDDVARVVTITLWSESAKTNKIAAIIAASLNAGQEIYAPNTTNASTQCPCCFPLPMKAGHTININWAAGGASTGGTDADGFIILYRKLPLT